MPDWRERQTWACGPEGMLNDAERVWRPRASPERLHLERFAVSRPRRTARAARWNSPQREDRHRGRRDAADGRRRGSVGIQMPFGCRMGICQSCVVGLVDGHVRDLRTGAEHEPGSRIQTCISAASGDCVLDI